ncbi:hypothetical protein CAPTEDRAFT_227823 [Capitella teleta]|uniref:Thioredoxin domain-containing protein n=1 Tax=Capitella teleta TaxID=283909 RepID=R7V7S3_CAPTE|nr:hypothetical protein CAPTEDRAFT_227823 [Capitella teleta]|eukprot:ELU14908.1 hypothetical protein CAPTEDRAFT_227823 [Capitella teleta]
MGNFWKEFRRVLHPHYVGNIFLSGIYILLKTTVPFCTFLFDDCSLELREMELLMFLGCIIVVKNRRQPSYTQYIGTVCMFSKILSSYLFFTHNPLMGVAYVILCLLHIAFLPEPTYSGPDYITYFRGVNLEDEINMDHRVTWLIEFYAAWSPACVTFAPTFAELSAKYNLDNLKFGKLDASRYSAVAEKFKVSTSSWSRQLPTVILFQNGKETRRRPLIDGKGKVVAKFMFNKENIIKAFDLNDLHLQCKKNPIKNRKDKKADLNTDKPKTE